MEWVSNELLYVIVNAKEMKVNCHKPVVVFWTEVAWYSICVVLIWIIIKSFKYCSEVSKNVAVNE